jgi:Ferritin-like
MVHQLGAVEGWRKVLFAIAKEEMLHWAVVQNLPTSVGSAPYVSRPHMPHQARGYPPAVQFRLLPFGEAALQHFVYLERTEGVRGCVTPSTELGRRAEWPLLACVRRGDLVMAEARVGVR